MRGNQKPADETNNPRSKGERMISRTRQIASLALVLVFSTAGAVQAQQAAAPTEEQVKGRLAFIENALDKGQPRARTWFYGWVGAYAAGTAVQWGLSRAHWDDLKPADDSPGAPMVHDRGFAQDMLIGGGTTALGVIGLLIDPFLPAQGTAKLKSLPDATSDERLAKLARAEELLRQCAERERSGQGFVTHLLNIGVNAAAGIVTAAAFKRPWTDGLLTFAAGEAVSLANIYTQPRRAIHDLQDYEARIKDRPGDVAPEPRDRNWSLSLYPGGFSFSLSW